MSDKLSKNVVKETISVVDNPLTRGVAAAGVTAAAIAATTAFGPIGVVGAGWALVYGVFGGTVALGLKDLYINVSKERAEMIRKLSADNKAMFDNELDKLNRMLNEKAISKENFDELVKKAYNKYSD